MHALDTQPTDLPDTAGLLADGPLAAAADGSMPAPRPAVGRARRVVVKLGTRVLLDDAGTPRLDRLDAFAASVAALCATGRQVVVVTSGAVGLGRGLLGLAAGDALDADGRRACAAIGQGRLASLYQDSFAAHGLLTAQMLLTGPDLCDGRAIGLRTTFERILAAGVVPIVNENDAVGHGLGGVGRDAPRFTDNDGLAARVAERCDAELLLLLTDVDGVFDDDPGRVPHARLLERIDGSDAGAVASLLSRLGTGSGGLSRGGMRSKVVSALLAAGCGCHAVIAAGAAHRVVDRLAAGHDLGTYFPATSPVTTTPAIAGTSRYQARFTDLSAGDLP